MQTVQTKAELQSVLSTKKVQGKKIALIPTMGALHEGHLSLIESARNSADIIVVSIFVNPTQFAPHEDFDSYPRTESDDAEQLENAGVDFLFLPSEQELYPNGYDIDVKPGEAAKGLETDFRPHFFDGVVNVVYRLFDAVKPDVTVFGQKDFQQLQVIKDMIEEQALSIELISAPIARDEHGLALSSRNEYLSESELQIARMLNKTLRQAAQNGDTETAKNVLLTLGFDKVDYIEKRWNRMLGAAWIGKTRLIDNVSL